MAANQCWFCMDLCKVIEALAAQALLSSSLLAIKNLSHSKRRQLTAMMERAHKTSFIGVIIKDANILIEAFPNLLDQSMRRSANEWFISCPISSAMART